MTYLVLSGEVNGLLRNTLTSNWLDQQPRAAHEVLIVEREAPLVLRERDEVWAQDRQARNARLAERRVPHGEHGVPQAKDVAHDALVRIVEEVRLAALRVDVRVCPHERREDRDSIPSHEHLRLGVAEEASEVGCARRFRQCGRWGRNVRGSRTSRETEPGDVVREDHLHADGHVLPSAEVVAGPHRAEALRTSVERARQNEGAFGRIRPCHDGLRGQVGL